MDSKNTTKGNMEFKPNASRISSNTSTRKYGAHAGLKFNFNTKKELISKSVSLESRTVKKQENVITVTKQRVENQTNREGRTGSGMEDSATTLRVDVKVNIMKNSINRPQTTKNIQDDSKIFLQNEDTDLCSNITTYLSVLQPRPVSSRIPKSHGDNTLKLQVVTSDVSKIPSLNAQQISKDRSTELEKPKTQITPKKYGTHTGLKFPFIEKNVKSGETFNFSKKTSISKTYYSKIEKRSTQSKETTTNGGNSLRK